VVTEIADILRARDTHGDVLRHTFKRDAMHLECTECIEENGEMLITLQSYVFNLRPQLRSSIGGRSRWSQAESHLTRYKLYGSATTFGRFCRTKITAARSADKQLDFDDFHIEDSDDDDDEENGDVIESQLEVDDIDPEGRELRLEDFYALREGTPQALVDELYSDDVYGPPVSIVMATLDIVGSLEGCRLYSLRRTAAADPVHACLVEYLVLCCVCRLLFWQAFEQRSSPW